MDNSRQVPYSQEKEEALIGSVILDPSWLDVITLGPEAFYIHRNKWIWQAFLSLKSKGEAIDFVTVTDELSVMGRLEDIGGAAYLTGICNNVPSSFHAESYAKRVEETYLRRQTLAEANQIAVIAYDETNDIVEERANAAVRLASTKSKSGAVHINKWMSDGYDLLDDWSKNPREHAGISTGLGDLDRVFGDGLLPGANLLIGEPGQGKSILATQIALNIARGKVGIVYYSAEMIWRDEYLRILSNLTAQKVSSLRKGSVDFAKTTAAAENVEGLNFWLDDPKGIKTAELRADLIRLKGEHDIKVMVFDYLGKLKDHQDIKDEWKRTEKIAVSLQDILVELDIAGLVIHQPNKEGYEKPSMAGIAGGKDVAFEVVCAVQIVNVPDEDNLREVINIKPPRGVEGYWKSCKLYKDPLYPRFELAAKEEKEVPLHWSNDY